MSRSSPELSAAQPRLLQAAIAGLLTLTVSACSTEERQPPGPGKVTSTELVGELDEAAFTALCDERNGTVEVMPHCNGFATAAGFAYDITTQELSEHTCKGANTCTGWNCVTEG